MYLWAKMKILGNSNLNPKSTRMQGNLNLFINSNFCFINLSRISKKCIRIGARYVHVRVHVIIILSLVSLSHSIVNKQ